MDESVPNRSVSHRLGVSPTNTLGLIYTLWEQVHLEAELLPLAIVCRRTGEWEKTTKITCENTAEPERKPQTICVCSSMPEPEQGEKKHV